MKKLVSAIPTGLKCETRNSCFSIEPRQAVIMPITSVILLSSQSILSIEGHLLHVVIRYASVTSVTLQVFARHVCDASLHCPVHKRGH